MLLNCGVGEDFESSLDCKEIQPVHPKGKQSWVFFGRTDADAPILWPPDVKKWLIGKDPDAGKRLKAGGERDDRGWDGWMASPTQWTWVWASSRSWWWTGKPDMLQSTGLQRVRYSWATELNWWLIHFVVQQKLTQHCKAIILQNCNDYLKLSTSISKPVLPDIDTDCVQGTRISKFLANWSHQ